MNSDGIGNVLIGLISGGTLAGVLTWLRFRGVDRATEEEKMAGVRTSDVDNLRSIIAELRESEARKAERIDNLERRMLLLEERERHALTRAAVHESWDVLTFSKLFEQDPTYPPPPPLTLARQEREARNEREDREERNDREDRNARNLREDQDARNLREER